MAIDNPQDVQSVAEATETGLAHSGKTGHEFPVTKFNTPLQDAVEQKLVDPLPDGPEAWSADPLSPLADTDELQTAPDPSLAPAATTELVTTPTRPRRRRGFGRLAAIAAPVVAAVAVTVAALSGGGGEEASKKVETPVAGADTPKTPPAQTPEITTGGSTQESYKTNKFEPVLPTATDPQGLLNQWDRNVNLAMANEDARYLEYLVVNMNSERGNWYLRRLQDVKNFRIKRDTDYSIVLHSKVESHDFSDPNNKWIVVRSFSTEKAFALDRVTEEVDKYYLITKTIKFDNGSGLKEYTITVPRLVEPVSPPKVTNR